MKVKNRNLTGFILMAILIFTYSLLYAAGFSGKIYYTKVNIWYEKPSHILSTNYHRGNILPIGTKVTIHSIKDDKIQFTPQGSGQLFTIKNHKKTSRMDTDKLFNRYFSIKDTKPGVGDYYQATEADLENIKKGIITTGMSKKAVIMAYGYPPAHKTPLLTSDIWQYWYARVHKVNVYFKNDKVFKIETIGPAAYPGIVKSEVNQTGGVKKDKIQEKKPKKKYDAAAAAAAADDAADYDDDGGGDE